jgi:hypothetical protein
MLASFEVDLCIEESNYLDWSCRSMVDRKITGLEVAGSSPVTITFY